MKKYVLEISKRTDIMWPYYSRWPHAMIHHVVQGTLGNGFNYTTNKHVCNFVKESDCLLLALDSFGCVT